MEKLSELSKPVAWTWHAYGLQHATTEEDERDELIADGVENSPLYSQEYVSALLAELEAKDKRIAELSRLLAHNIERSEEVEKRLATPVRLPNKNDAEFWFGSTFQVAKFDRAVERAISAAGFKFVGDE